MKQKFFPFSTYGLFIAALFCGCASSRFDSLSLSLNEGLYDDVIRQIPDSVLSDPSAIETVKIAGIAHAQKQHYSLADSLLTVYTKKIPDDDQAMYYLAVCADSLNDDLKAIACYRKYAESTSYRMRGSTAMVRSRELLLRRMRRDARHAIVYESSIAVSSIDTNTVAVLSFENNGSARDMDPLCRGLAEMVATDLSKVRALRVIERLRLQTVLEELSLGETALASPVSAPRIGKLVGAHRVVKGSFVATSDGMLHLDAAVTKTVDAVVEAFDSNLGPTENLFRAEKDVVLHLLRTLGIPLSAEEREAILVIPTENYFAFLRYAEGLEFEDRGAFAQAAASFRQALELDPNFSDARDQLDYTDSFDPTGGSNGRPPQLPGTGGGGTSVPGNLPQVPGTSGGTSTAGSLPQVPGTGDGTIVPRSPIDSDAITTIIERAATTLTHTGGYAPTFPNPGKTNPVLIRQPLPAPPVPPKP